VLSINAHLGPTIKQLRAYWGPPAINLYNLDDISIQCFLVITV
jgi:hypothetical protein